MKLTPLTVEERLMSRILNEGVLEEVDRVRWHAATVEKPRLDEPFQRIFEALLGKRVGNPPYQLISEPSAERRTGLGYLLCRTQTIEPGGQQALQSFGNRQPRQRDVEQIFVIELAQQPTFQDGLDQLFDK